MHLHEPRPGEKKVVADCGEMAACRTAPRRDRAALGKCGKGYLDIARHLEELGMLALHAKSPRVVAKVVDHFRKLALVKENGIHETFCPLRRLALRCSALGHIWLSFPALRHICGSLPPGHRASHLEAADDIAKCLSPVARPIGAIGIGERQALRHEKYAVKMVGHQLRFDQ